MTSGTSRENRGTRNTPNASSTCVRGGVDGAEITFKGLPCPNLFTGGDNCHTIYEYTCIQSMEKSYELLVKLCESCLDVRKDADCS